MDIGYGHIENCKGKAAAFEKAKKEGTTDGMKRALRNFGNILGNCVYDKDFVAKVSKIKVGPTRWDPDNLHRHADYAPVKKESVAHQSEGIAQTKRENAPGNGATEPEDEFATDDFDEVDFSDSHEFGPSDEHLAQFMPSDANAADSQTSNGQHHPVSSVRVQDKRLTRGNGSSDARQLDQKPPDAPVPQGQAAPLDFKPQRRHGPPPPPYSVSHNITPKVQPALQAAGQNENPPGLDAPLIETPTPPLATTLSGDPPVGFFNARAAETIQSAPGIPPQAPSFNPHLESPSIRKTAGVDHSKTKPVARGLVGAPSAPVLSSASRPNCVNLQADKARRVGMPGGGPSPLANRSLYKPPQMKRPAEGNLIQQPRPALGDVTSLKVNVPPDADGGGDVKRQRTGEYLLPAAPA
ncbi:MAG: hypothetical protein Q9213_006388 [Squamulea squamosa]